MGFVAYAAVKLQNGILDEQKNKWAHIKTVENIEYRWRVCGDRFCEVIAGVFEDKFDALRCAKKMQVVLLYATLGRYTPVKEAVPSYYASDLDSDQTGEINNGEQIFHSLRARQRFAGPGVFEVSHSIDEIDEYQPVSISISTSSTVFLDLSDIDRGYFAYNRDVHDLFQSIEVAENAHNFGIKMTIYCGLLEHLAKDERKNEETQEEINALIEHVKNSSLSDGSRAQLVQYLETGRNLSARQKCRKLIERYADIMYGDYPAKQILERAYSLRSKFSHGELVRYDVIAAHMKCIVLDVIKGYMCEKEIANT